MLPKTAVFIQALDKKKNAIIVSDNGIGIDDKDLIANLGTIANSGTQKFLENLKDEKNGIQDLMCAGHDVKVEGSSPSWADIERSIS